MRTAPEEAPLSRLRRARALRRAGILILAAFLLAGATGAFGVRSRIVRASGGGYELSVTYATWSRAGLATPWRVEVRKPGGFGAPIQLATTASYFDMFDENGFDPDPAKATTIGDMFLWEFDPPVGDTLTVRFDARVEPARQGGARATTAVFEDDRPVVSVRYETRLMP